MAYYNTNREDDKPALDKHTQRQEDVIMQFYRSHPQATFTPFEVQAACLPAAPITSVRRAMTDLTRKGLLLKQDIRKERYGRNNYTWKLNAEPKLF